MMPKQKGARRVRLKPCPFCGVEAKGGPESFYRVCNHNRGCFLYREDYGRLIRPGKLAAWNRRTP